MHLKPKGLRISNLHTMEVEGELLTPLNFDFGVLCVAATAYALKPGHGSRCCCGVCVTETASEVGTGPGGAAAAGW